MKINEIPEQVWQALPHRGYVAYSFDVTADGKKGVLALCSEDPAFPELWKYNNVTKDALRIDDHSVLIDFPMSKAFWAENQRDMIVATPDDQPHFALLILNDDSDELEEMQVVENPSAYVLKKAQEVIDLTRS